MAYVYRFKDVNNKIVYIGKTIDINRRMNEHFRGKGHLSSECYTSVAKIEYQKYNTESDALIMEVYYICKYNPKYNKQGKSKDMPTIELNEGKWRTYSKIKPIKYNTTKEGYFTGRLMAISFVTCWIYLILEWIANLF